MPENETTQNDFVNWSAPEISKFEDNEDTNNNFSVENINNRESEKTTTHLNILLQSKLGRKIRRITLYTWAALAVAGGFEIGRSYMQFNKEAQQILQSQPENPKFKKDYSNQIEFLSEKIGEDKLLEIAKQHIQAEKKIAEKDQTPPKIRDAENSGYDETVLNQLWQDGVTYPNGWINGEVKEIEFVDPQFYDNYGTINGEQIKNLDLIRLITEKSNSQKKSLLEHDWIFSHELGHANDWETDNEADFAERINLVKNIIDVIDHTDIEKYYPGLKNMQFSDEKEKNYFTAKEIWAAMCEWYFQFPEALKKDLPEAYDLVDNWIHRKDVSFNPEEKADLRIQIINNTESNNVSK